MYKYTNIVNNKNIDLFVILICSNFKKNIEGLEKKFKLKFPKKLIEYFKTKKNKFLKQMVGDKLFIISKVNDEKCSKEDLDSSIRNICSSIFQEEKDSKKKYKVQIVLSPIKSFIRYQVIRTVYHLYDYKKKKNLEITFCGVKNLKKIILNSVLEGEIINKMRTMVNQPANIMTTDAFLKNVTQFKKKHLSVEVFDKKKLKKEKFNLILAVNKGSKQNPYLLTVKWMPNKKEKPIVLVGKGVMFDTGGINIKLYDFHDMKTDMTGAAVAWIIMKLCAINNLKKNVVALIPLVENMIGPDAQRPGDVIESYSGKTVEILNTDAEGRLIMADALSYSEKFDPKFVVDISTLTGQAGSIFNNLSIVTLGNYNPLIKSFNETARDMNERTWELPLWNEYRKYLNSEVADIKNSSETSSSGTITAATFLNEFVPKDTKWLHLDIAGVSFKLNSATGISILSLYELLKKKH